jgi:hypothetical protein
MTKKETMICQICEQEFPTKRMGTVPLHKRLADTHGEKIYNSSRFNYVVCKSCHVIASSSMRINDYNYVPQEYPTYRSKTKDGLMGIELELELKSPHIFKEVALHHVGNELHNLSLSKLFYAKHDGSMKYGIEFVSNPIDYSIWQTLPLERLICGLSQYFKVDKTCGMHVHIDKEIIPYNTFVKMNGFLFRNRMFFYLLGGRYKTSGFLPDKVLKSNKYFSFIPVSKVSANNHYKYLALAYRENTVEFRLYGATLEYQQLMDNIILSYYLPKFVTGFTLAQSTHSNIMLTKFIRFLRFEQLK